MAYVKIITKWNSLTCKMGIKQRTDIGQSSTLRDSTFTSTPSLYLILNVYAVPEDVFWNCWYLISIFYAVNFMFYKCMYFFVKSSHFGWLNKNRSITKTLKLKTKTAPHVFWKNFSKNLQWTSPFFYKYFHLNFCCGMAFISSIHC